MMDVEDSDVLYRHFIAVATGTYADPAFGSLPVADEVAEFRRWLCGPERGERAFTDEGLAFEPTIDMVRAALVNPLWTPAHAVAVYVTGHGFEAGGHWIALRETLKKKPASTALPTDHAIRWLAEQDVDHLLVIIDLCYAGSALGQLLEADLEPRKGWLMLASAGKRQQAAAGALAHALKEFLEEAQSGKYGYGAHFSASQFISRINELLPADQSLAPLQTNFPTGPYLCLPNPAWRPAPEVGSAIRPADLVSHWSPRARGVAEDADPGWYFTGRPGVMRRVLAFALGDPGTLLISGRTGTGKSAVLSRLVTLADERFVERYASEVAAVPAELRPPVGAVDAAVLATRKLPIEVLDQICAAVHARRRDDARGVPSVDELLEVWWAWLRECGRPVTVVVDALDEAIDPRAVAGDVLAKLDPPDGSRRVRLLVGVRSPGGEAADDGPDRAGPIADTTATLLGAERIRLDEPPYLDDRDVAAFARNTLMLTVDSPYTSADPSVVDGVVEQIAEKAGTSYLFARAAAASLARRREVVQPRDPRWRAALGDDVIGLVRDDIEQTAGTPAERERAVHLLRAVAFGHGTGLPWFRVWPEVATAIAGSLRYGDRDIESLLASPLAGYLSTDREDGITAYRIAEDTVRAALRDRWWRLIGREAPTESESSADVEARITAALTPRRPRLRVKGEALVPEYVRRHLVEHAAAGGVLDRDAVPDWFLPQVEPTRLREVDPTSTCLPLSPVVRRAAHRWDWSRPHFNAAALRMYSAICGEPLDRNTFDDDWIVPWASASSDRSEVLGAQPGLSAVAAAGASSGRAVVVAAGSDGLRVWDLAGGTRRGESVAHVPQSISSLAVVTEPGGRTVVLMAGGAGGVDGGVWSVDVMSTRLEARLVVANTGPVSALGAAVLNDGRIAVATGDRLGRFASWDLESGARIGDAAQRHTGPVNALTTVTTENGQAGGGREVWAVTAGDDGAVRIWDLATGYAVGEPMTGHHGSVSAISAVLVDERPVAVTGGRDETVRIWDLVERRERGAPLVGHVGTVWAVSISVSPGGRICAVTCAEDPAVRVWDLREHALLDDSLISHRRPVGTLAAIPSVGADSVLVTGGRDGTIRSWPLTARPLAGGETVASERDRISSLALGARPDGSVFAVTGSDADHAILWSLADRASFAAELIGHTRPVAAVRTAIRPNKKTIILTAAWDATLRMWDPVDGRQLGDALCGHEGAVLAVDTVTYRSRLMAVSGGIDGTVRFWDLEGASLVTSSRAGATWITAIAAVSLPDGRAIAVTGTRDGFLRAWDAGRGQPLGAPFRAVRGGVRALATAVIAGRVVAVSGGDDGAVRIWDLLGEALGPQMTGHIGQVAAVATGVSGAGRAVAFTGGDDAAVRVWDLAAGAALATELPTPTPVRALAVLAGRPEPRLVMAGNGFLAVADRRDRTGH
jgi:WD40 repeat protein